MVLTTARDCKVLALFFKNFGSCNFCKKVKLGLSGILMVFSARPGGIRQCHFTDNETGRTWRFTCPSRRRPSGQLGTGEIVAIASKLWPIDSCPKGNQGRIWQGVRGSSCCPIFWGTNPIGTQMRKRERKIFFTTKRCVAFWNLWFSSPQGTETV